MANACTESADKVIGNENPVQSILISEIGVNDDFTSTSFKLTNRAKDSYYSGVVVIAEFRREGRKIGSERMVVYPPLFGPGKQFVHEQPLYPASGTDELHLYVERASFYPEKELKSILENQDR